ncbi:MAG: glutamate--cysteine ligase [Actinobacteria bacterium]|jgi:carboxylate-amine ligase|nr:glutamate--cysteine ligase [Actinomycetota bacterium]
MSIAFAPSPRSTLGLEWELALVDQHTRELKNIAPTLLPQLQQSHPSSGFPHFTGELLQNTIELVTAPHSHVADATADLRELAILAETAAATEGAELIGSGSHPFSRWDKQLVTDHERYHRVIEKYRWWGRNMLIWGVHIHIGIDREDRVVPIMHALLTHLPHLLALSASSPFWAGDSTGYASNRTLRFQQLPTAGLPWEVDDWADVERVLDDLSKTGIIAEPTEARWDIRPAPKWGTLEVRFCDGASTLASIGALAALTQCLAEHYQRQADLGLPLPRLQPWFVRENKWRAARYGLDAEVITSAAGRQAPLRDEIAALLVTLAPVAASLGCEAELAHVAVMLDGGPHGHGGGTSAERQLRLFEELGGADAGQPALVGVVDALTREFRAGLE